MKCKLGGYFSVEAALVFPLVIGTILLLIYLGFYQYDRCMLEFDMGTIALRGCSCDEQDRTMVLDEMERSVRGIYKEKYIAWEAGDINMEMEGNRIRVSGTGKIRFPFGFLMQRGMTEVWEIKANYENRRLDPVAFIRTYKKLAGGE